MTSNDPKLLQVNLPGTTLFLDWRYSKVLNIYRLLCFILDTLHVMMGITMAIATSLYRILIPNSPKNLRRKLVVVTGSGHGIGMELSLKLGELGATLICLDINQSGNKETEKKLKKTGCKYYVIQCDVSSKHDVNTVGNKILEDIGIPDIVINNAAITKRKSFLQHTEQELQDLFSINVVGPMLLTKKLLPAMLQDPSHKHHIVGVSSIVGMLGTPNMVPYSATKFAMTGFMEALNYELMADRAKNIVITTVHPFLVSMDEVSRKPSLRYQELIGIVSVRKAVDEILLGIQREDRDIYIPSSLHFLTRILRLLPVAAQAKLLDYIEFGSGP